jgi:3-hydroxyisobutyrate dehydrogenase-like beta-hydroxyacid dehydrogenase
VQTTESPLRIGYIGVGLMGHGAAKNIVTKGYPLTVFDPYAKDNVRDLVERGATEAASVVDLASKSDVVFLNLPSSQDVEQVVYGADGLMAAIRPGMIIVDSTTADPRITRKIGADLAARSVQMIDAPNGRTPKEIEAGKVSTYVGGSKEAIDRVMPVFNCYADTIIRTGDLGSGTTMKLVNNFITIGTGALIAEAVATAHKLGVDLKILVEVLSAGGANSVMFQWMKPWIVEGDDSHLQGPFRIAAKDIKLYARLADSAPAMSILATAVVQIYQLALIQGHANENIPVLPGILAELNGSSLRPINPGDGVKAVTK